MGLLILVGLGALVGSGVWLFRTMREVAADWQVTNAPEFAASDTTQAFSPSVVAGLSPKARAALLARIKEDPAAHTLQERLRPSELPVWHNNALEPRAAIRPHEQR